MATMSTRTETIEASQLSQLAAQLRGELIKPGDGGYDSLRSVWNAMIDRRPALIARCRGVGDVVACVNFAREHDLPLSIKGGGHNIAGLALCDDGLLIDMSLMRGVWVDRAAQVAHAQAGCLLGDVDRETQLYGLATVLGFVSATGIAGLTLGGGFGYLSRRFGWTTDNVRAMELVTAEGQIIRASSSEHPDLFWALRGGGGNFGVVTSFEYGLHPVGPQIMGGAIAWRAADAPDVLAMYRTLMEQAPPEHVCVAGLRLAPPAPWLPKEIHGKPIVAFFICDTGPLSEGAARVAPIKAFGHPVGDIVQPRSYLSQQSLLDATQPPGRRYYWKSEYLPDLAPGLFSQLIAHAEQIRSPHSSILIFPLGGALSQLPGEHSAVGNRDAAFVVNIGASWLEAADDAPNIAWARTTWQAIRGFSTGGTYVNFLTEEEGDERVRAAYGANYGRLAEVKRRYDPQNLFRVNKNIRPG